MTRLRIFMIGIAATLAFTGLWHGPLGAGERLAARAEAVARRTLDIYEFPLVQAKLQRNPMARTLILSGPSDDFQRREWVRVLNDVPGILVVRWDPGSLPQETVPVEAGKAVP